MLRPSSFWDEAADELIDEAQLAAKSADHFARMAEAEKDATKRRALDRRLAEFRGAEALATSRAKHWRERARLLRAHEDAVAAEIAACETWPHRYRMIRDSRLRVWLRRFVQSLR